ncbi:MAG: hypothetical protein AAFV45_06800 [Pseudomonadota bacterium]
MLTIKPVDGANDVDDWLEAQARVYADDPAWIAPLRMAEKERISPKHNPFFSFGRAQLFVAYQNGAPVGRISAHINDAALKHSDQTTGHFGFFECIDDPQAAHGLLDAAAKWLKQQGMAAVAGPFSFSINEDLGLLVEGYEVPPALMSSHARPWMARHAEDWGLRKAIDLFAYRMKPSEPPEVLTRLAALASRDPKITVRPMDMSNYTRDVQLIFDIYNDAWSENWGFIPFSDQEIAKLGKEMRPIMRGKFGRFVELDGEPVAMIIVLPDINRVIAPFHGRLLPLNWAKLGLEIMRDRWTTARVPLLGIRKTHRRPQVAAALLSLLVAEVLELGRSYDLDWVEFSWVLETNTAMTRLAEEIAGPPCRVYRMYEREI